MGYKKRLLYMGIATLVTTIIYYFMVDVVGHIVFNFEDKFGYTLGLALADCVSMIGMIASNLPSLILLWLTKYPNGIIVSLLASVEAFLISYVAVPVILSMAGMGLWKVATFISILSSYLIIDYLINIVKHSMKYRMAITSAVIGCSAILLALFLKG